MTACFACPTGTTPVFTSCAFCCDVTQSNQNFHVISSMLHAHEPLMAHRNAAQSKDGCIYDGTPMHDWLCFTKNELPCLHSHIANKTGERLTSRPEGLRNMLSLKHAKFQDFICPVSLSPMVKCMWPKAGSGLEMPCESLPSVARSEAGKECMFRMLFIRSCCCDDACEES